MNLFIITFIVSILIAMIKAQGGFELHDLSIEQITEMSTLVITGETTKIDIQEHQFETEYIDDHMTTDFIIKGVCKSEVDEIVGGKIIL